MASTFLSKEQEETFENLKKPTFSLVESYYSMPSDLKKIFVGILAVYEANPTTESIKKIKSLLYSNDGIAVKKARLLAFTAKIPLKIRAFAEKKYLGNQHPVPAGMPTSGEILSVFGVISDKEKEHLMNAQAAVRILDNFQNFEQFIGNSSQSEEEKYGVVLNSSRTLKTPVQKMEDLSRLYISSFARFYQLDNSPFDIRFQKQTREEKVCSLRDALYRMDVSRAFGTYAIDVLKKSSEHLENRDLSNQINNLTKAFTFASSMCIDDICRGVLQIASSDLYALKSEILPYSLNSDSNPLLKRVQKRTSQILECVNLKAKENQRQ
ncbi:MAG: hypothetical protein E7013_05700 [Alphaproteobacteria bacterium]|nr:hypothetical protein [Alphaproteobacteria bacterium]